MADLFVLFVLGVVNFAVHKAVLESGHPLIEQLGWMRRVVIVPVSLWVEYAVLLTALAFAQNGWGGAVFAFSAYTAFNAATGWFVLSGRL